MERSAHRFSIPVLAVLAILVGCVTVNVYFPAARVEKTAEKIVDEVYQEKKEPPQQEPAEKPQSSNERGIFRSIARLAGWGWQRVAPIRRRVKADHAARRQPYEEVAKALNLNPEQVSQVRQIFSK